MCFDYRISNSLNKYEAERLCEEKTGENELASKRIISIHDTSYFNKTRYHSNEESCNNLPPDCNKTVHITSAATGEKTSESPEVDVGIYPNDGNEPSFTLESKPRIDNIDYVTYILGALGSWLGFSFLGVNPIPYLLKVASNTPVSSNVDTGQTFLELRTELKTELKAEMKTEIQNEWKSISDLMKSSLDSMNEQMKQQKKQSDKMIRSLFVKINSIEQNQNGS